MIPPNFLKIVKDFVSDLVGTFPELKENETVLALYSQEEGEVYQQVFDHAVAVFPQHMADILSEKESLFESSCVFLPGVDFKPLWNENITEKTKAILWKYLKLILFSILGHINLNEEFSALLQGFDMQQTMEDMKKNFETPQDPFEGMMNGKLGNLAKEIAQETLGEVGEVEEFQTMMKDPSKLFSLMHTVGDKLDKKIKAGDLKESELISEASELLEKMKGMPGMKQFESMFGKMNAGATQAKMKETMTKAKTKERLQNKLKAKKDKKK
jgi:hypothetical protein